MTDKKFPNDKSYEELKKQFERIIPLNTPNEILEIICIDDIEPENQPWLWPNIIPLDAFTLFAGVGGLGKSQLLMFIAAHVSNGKPFQAGGLIHKLPQGSVLILSSEDSQKYALSPRLRALGADTTKIHKIKSVVKTSDPHKKRLMALDSDLKLLKETLNDLKENGNQVKLIIIDPAINFIGKTKDYINTEVSNFLFGLTELAEEFNLAIILNKHLRKKDSAAVGSAMDEIAGSSAWGTTARQVWIICRDHEDKKKILFLDGKSNIKEQMTGMSFKIQTTNILNKNDQIVTTSRIEWSDEVVKITPDEAVNEEKYNKSKMQNAQEFIISYLSKMGERTGEDVRDAAIESKIPKSTYFDSLNILIKDEKVIRKPGFNKQKYTLILV